MDFGKAIQTCFNKYATFTGRASVPEYWWWVLFTVVLGFVAGIIGTFTTEYLGGVVNLAVFLPSLAVSIRRMHDINKSGWWVLINLIPLIGWIWFIILAIKPSYPADNQYGLGPIPPSFH